jgi:phage tail tape-measure protein
MAEKLLIDILARDKSKQALSGVQKRLGNVKNAVFSLRGALVGLGAGAVIKGFVDVGKEVESLNIRFKFLFGSAEEGSKAFDNLAKFAGTVPFSLEEISRASGNLAVVAKDAEDLNRVLEITGNVAAVTGLDFETTSSQIQRAFAGGIGAADLFRERGVRALLGFEAGAKVSAEETVKRFEELFSGNGRFAGATNDLATTLEGTISMLGDKFFNFQKDVAEGFFD